MGAYFLKKQARSPILEGFGRNIYALLSFSGQQYNKLETFEKSTPKQLLAMRGLRVDMRIAICEAFVDVMVNLKECCPSLTNDDLFYCILSSLHCSKTVIMELMNTTSDALKTRKNRIKNKMGTYLFEQVFNIDNL